MDLGSKAFFRSIKGDMAKEVEADLDKFHLKCVMPRRLFVQVEATKCALGCGVHVFPIHRSSSTKDDGDAISCPS